MNCKKCEVEMVPGIGLRETYRMGLPDFHGNTADSRGQTMIASGESNMVNVLKCPECGYSVTTDTTLPMEGE